MLRLIQINGAGVGRVYNLNDFQTVGRSPANHLVVDDPAVSREQCAIQVQNEVASVVARDPASPVLVNGFRVDGHIMRPGDVLQLGQMQFLLQTTEPTILGTSPLPPTLVPGQAPQPAQPGPISWSNSVHWNQVNVAQSQGPSPLWGLLTFFLAIPLLILGVMALPVLPYIATMAGIGLAVWGVVECSQWQVYAPNSLAAWAKIGGGVALVTLGVFWIVTFQSRP